MKWLRQAARLFGRAARNDHAPSQYYLGWMYHEGEGLQRDHAEAAYLCFEIAARARYRKAFKLREEMTGHLSEQRKKGSVSIRVDRNKDTRSFQTPTILVGVHFRARGIGKSRSF
ncbi:MAG TPA: hypothetical protein PL126_06530 [Candidatus Cloacimonadota bacterium]|nr:hypothetical protein [Candidatus Cloacimonadota bacterium]